MRGLEIIELQSVDSSQQKLKSKLNSIIADLYNTTNKKTIKFYHRLSLDGDLSIHTEHRSEKIDINGSPKGMQLASALREFGLTNHSIWIEISGE